ncbi:coiled-coil domain-containing protein 96-like [Vespula squamosa]|uniref:Coiled-coil domain-containing protein 96-like n=1 Tax=Vespula squamosa TaxID=30214 RepID=A0ABD2ABP5_VESSQ
MLAHDDEDEDEEEEEEEEEYENDRKEKRKEKCARVRQAYETSLRNAPMGEKTTRIFPFPNGNISASPFFYVRLSDRRHCGQNV